MSRDKQIEEMAHDMCEYYYEGTCYQDKKPCDLKCESMTDAQYLYEKGYRKQKQGRWLKKEYKFRITYDYECSECHRIEHFKANYCRYCGAEMKEDVDG